MAISTIDIFPLFKQLPVVIGTVTSPRGMLILVAENVYGSRRSAQAQQNFQRGIKEDG